MPVTAKDIAWLAGLLEGEGYFGVKAKTSPVISISMTDEDVMARAGALMGCTPTRVNRQHANRKDLYRVQIYGIRAASWMMTVLPLMGARRGQVIKESLAAWHTQVWHRTHCKRGHAFDEANTTRYGKRKQRACRTCKNQNARENYHASKMREDKTLYFQHSLLEE